MRPPVLRPLSGNDPRSGPQVELIRMDADHLRGTLQRQKQELETSKNLGERGMN